MADCRLAQAKGKSTLQCIMAAGSLRNIPSPEQGASTSTRSNAPGRALANRAGGSHRTTAFVTPMRSRLRLNSFARAGTGSLANSSPQPRIRSAIWAAFPPGAAHRSSTRSPGSGASAGTDAIALGSCR